MHRLFVAIELPETVKDRLARLQIGLPGARWVSYDNLHLTLRFIGEVDSVQADDIYAALGRVHAAGFTIELCDLGLFPPRGMPHTLWVGVRRLPALEQLKGRIDGALIGAGIGPDDRKFLPHVTIARLHGVRAARLGALLGEIVVDARASFEVRSFALFSSTLGHGGANYTVEAEFSLEHAAAIRSHA